MDLRHSGFVADLLLLLSFLFSVVEAHFYKFVMAVLCVCFFQLPPLCFSPGTALPLCSK